MKDNARQKRFVEEIFKDDVLNTYYYVSLRFKNDTKKVDNLQMGYKKPRISDYCFLLLCLSALVSCVDSTELCSGAIAQGVNIRFVQEQRLRNRFGEDSIVRRDTALFVVSISLTGTDTTLIPDADSLIALGRLPINPLADSTLYLITSARAGLVRTDSLWLGYQREILVISPECGFVNRFRNFRIIQHSFDSLQTRLGVNENLDVQAFFIP